MYYLIKFVKMDQIRNNNWDYYRLIRNAQQALHDCRDQDMKRYWDTCLAKFYRKVKRLH